MVEEKKPVVADKAKLLWDLMDNIPDSIYFKNGNNRFIMVSKTKAEHVGSTPEEIIGKTDFDFYPKEQAENMAADDKRVMETGKSIVDRVERIVRPGGEERWASVTKSPLRGEKGAIIGTMGISRDITELKRAEEERVRVEVAAAAKLEAEKLATEAAAQVTEAVRMTAEKYKAMIDELKPALNKLTEESNLFQSFLDSIPTFIYLKDRDGRYLRVSKFYHMIHPESMIGKTAFDLYPEDEARVATEDDKRVMETGKPIIDEERRYTAPDGSKHNVLITKAPSFDEKGNIVGIVGITREKT